MKLTLTLAEAPTDVLVYLVDNGPADRDTIAAGMPPDAVGDLTVHDIKRGVHRAINLLHELRFVRLGPGSTRVVWEATDDGRSAIECARAEAAA